MMLRFLLILVVAASMADTALADGLASLHIRTMPEGAAVYVDGVRRGATPLTLSITEGEHELFLVKEGLAPVKQRRAFTADQTEFIDLALRPLERGLVVTSQPSDAEASLDGRIIGRTPLSRGDLPTGLHTLRLRLDGFEEKTMEVDLKDDRVTAVNTRLKGPPVTVWLEGPEGTLVTIDGISAGAITETSTKLTLRANIYAFRFEKEGYYSEIQRSVDPYDGAFVRAEGWHKIPGYWSWPNPRWYLVSASVLLSGAGAAFAIQSGNQAHQARQTYNHAFQESAFAKARENVQTQNRRMLAGVGVAVLGATGAWLAWPEPKAEWNPTLALTADSAVLAWNIY